MMKWLRFSLQQIPRDLAERFAAAVEGFEGGEGGARPAGGFSAGFFQAENLWIGRLLRFGVFARCLSQLLSSLRSIQDIVYDLEGKADGVAEAGKDAKLGGGGVTCHYTEANAGGDERGGFAFVNPAKF